MVLETAKVCLLFPSKCVITFWPHQACPSQRATTRHSKGSGNLIGPVEVDTSKAASTTHMIAPLVNPVPTSFPVPSAGKIPQEANIAPVAANIIAIARCWPGQTRRPNPKTRSRTLWYNRNEKRTSSVLPRLPCTPLGLTSCSYQREDRTRHHQRRVWRARGFYVESSNLEAQRKCKTWKLTSQTCHVFHRDRKHLVRRQQCYKSSPWVEKHLSAG